jgi:alpha-ketoglutarate-dependent taurine dioxygenase
MNMEAIETPAVWRGKELFGREDWLSLLDDQAIDELDRALDATSQLPIDQITAENFSLPTLSSLILDRQQSLERFSGIAMIRGLPIQRYDDSQASRLLYGLTSHLGTPLSQTVDGSLVFPVRDERLGDSDPKARGPSSAKRLSYHTDRCDVIAFLCVRQAREGGENYVVSSAALYNEMLTRRPELVEQLMKSYRYQRHNVDSGNELPYYEQPIFSFCDGHFAASLLRVLIERAYRADGAIPMSQVQREALDYLEELADDPSLHVRFRQQPGDIVILNNWVTMHRRSEFVDHEESDRRRLLWRIWLSVPNSRPIDPRFAASYGATEAGTLRGGMRER